MKPKSTYTHDEWIAIAGAGLTLIGLVSWYLITHAHYLPIIY